MVLSDRAARYIKREVNETFAELITGRTSVVSVTKTALEDAHAENARLRLIIREARDNGLKLMEAHDTMKTFTAAKEKSLKNDVVAHINVAEGWRHKAVVRGNHLKKEQGLLTYARPLKAHVKHRSLGRPPTCGVRLHAFTVAVKRYWRRMDWDPTDEERKEIADIEEYFDADPSEVRQRSSTTLYGRLHRRRRYTQPR